MQTWCGCDCRVQVCQLATQAPGCSGHQTDHLSAANISTYKYFQILHVNICTNKYVQHLYKQIKVQLL